MGNKDQFNSVSLEINKGEADNSFYRPSKSSGFLSFRALVVGLLVLVIVGGGIAFFAMNRQNDDSTPKENQISAPASELLNSETLSLEGTNTVKVSGRLQVDQGLFVTPSVQPTGPKAGDIYYDKATNQLAYYNGSSFVFLNETQQGIQSLVAGSSNVTITTDENGQAVISVTGSSGGGGRGTVTSSGGTAGKLPLFTSTQNIEDSILAQAGSAVTVGGNLNVSGGLTLGSALAVTSGGTGASSLTTNGVLVGNGTSAITSVAAGGSGLCLLSTAGAPSWGPCPGGGGGVTSLNSLTGALTLANASGVGSTITIDNASTSTKGIASFNSTNFSVASGAVNTIQDIGTGASPTFAGVNTNAITPSGALTVGASGQSFTIQGSAASTLTATSGGNTTTFSFQAPTANVTYRLLTAAAGTYDICTSVGNCATGGSFINNSATLQTNANVAIQSANDASVTMLLKNRATQSADILRVVHDNDSLVFKLDTFGSAHFAGSAEFQSFIGVGFAGAASAGATVRVYTVQDANLGIVINGNGGQTADLLQLNSQGVLGVFTVGASGAVTSKNASNSTTAFQIQRADATPVLTVDTSGNKVVVAALDVTGNLTVNGHLVSGGSAPSIAAGAAACTSPTVSVNGTDTAGLITVTSGTGCGAGGKLATVTFNSAFGAAPRVALTAAGSTAAGLHYYVDNATIATTAFDVTTQAGDTIVDATTYRWYYHVIQ